MTDGEKELEHKCIMHIHIVQENGEAMKMQIRLIRRFIPKGIDITPISEEYIQKIEDWINNYPRAMFNFKSTNEILSEMCA